MFYLYETLIQPIVLYGSDIWGAYPNCTKDINTVFLWFIRCTLNVKATTCNIITIGESGIIPPSIKCHENVILNFIRLNCMPQGPIVKKVFQELKKMHEMGFECWFSKVLKISLTQKYHVKVDIFAYPYFSKKSFVGLQTTT